MTTPNPYIANLVDRVTVPAPKSETEIDKDNRQCAYTARTGVAQQTIQALMRKRKWTTESLAKLTQSSVADLHDPLLMENMASFVDELHTHKDKTITIIPDYDADGILSGSLLAGSLSLFGFKSVHVYAPTTHTGYGVTVNSSMDALRQFPDTDVVITTDNGSNAFEGVAYLRNLNIPVLVTDHHKAGTEDPTQICVNPNRPTDTYPFKGLSGTGVIWKAMQAYAQTYTGEREQRLVDFLIILVGISTISDVMPLLDENRYIVQESVKLLQDADFLAKGAECVGDYGAIFSGLSALHGVCARAKKFDYGFDEMTLGFVFGPMLNSPRRMTGTSTLGFKLLLNPSREDAVLSAVELFGTNEERKTLMKEYGELYFSPIITAVDQLEYMISVVPFRSGLIGLLAGRFTNQFDLPSIVFGSQMVDKVHFGGMVDGLESLSGSGRSPEWFDLHGALTQMSEEKPEWFKSFGGHPQAAGVAIYTAYYEPFRQRFTELVSQQLLRMSEVSLDDSVVLVEDPTVWLGHSNEDDVAVDKRTILELMPVLDFIETLRPFGQSFRQPSFGTHFSTTDTVVSFMGGDKQHVKFTCPNGLVVIQWNGAKVLKQQLSDLSGPFKFKAEGLLSVNTFNERHTMQLIADKVRVV